MAGSSAMHSEHTHARSISFPNRLQYDAINIEAELNKLRTSELSSISPNSCAAEAIQGGLTRMTELFARIEDLIHSPNTQQALHHRYAKLVDQNLDVSVALLDSCGDVRDVFLVMKEQVQDLQSALRRKGCNASIEGNIHSYICFRKKMKKDIAKCLEGLKRTERNIGSHSINLDHHEVPVIRVLRELSTAMTCMFRALLSFLSVPITKTKATGWLLLSRLMQTGSLASRKFTFNEVGNVDLALYYLQDNICRSDAKVDLQATQKRLDTLYVAVEALEAGLDCLLRCLIRYRVCLLNIITP